MDLKVKLTNIAIVAGLSSLTTTVITGLSSMIGRNWLSIGACGGFGFGLIQGTISRIATENLTIISSDKARFLVSEMLGGATAYGVSYAAASLGFIATPVSIPTAVVLTVASLALKHFFGQEIVYSIYKTTKHLFQKKKEDKIKVYPNVQEQPQPQPVGFQPQQQVQQQQQQQQVQQPQELPTAK